MFRYPPADGDVSEYTWWVVTVGIWILVVIGAVYYFFVYLAFPSQESTVSPEATRAYEERDKNLRALTETPPNSASEVQEPAYKERAEDLGSLQDAPAEEIGFDEREQNLKNLQEQAP